MTIDPGATEKIAVKFATFSLFKVKFGEIYPGSGRKQGEEPMSEAIRENFWNMSAQNPFFEAYFYHFRTGPLSCKIS